jgi:hypothetical protein
MIEKFGRKKIEKNKIEKSSPAENLSYVPNIVTKMHTTQTEEDVKIINDSYNFDDCKCGQEDINLRNLPSGLIVRATPAVIKNFGATSHFAIFCRPLSITRIK